MAVSLRLNRKEEPFVGSMVKRNRGFSREILTTPRKMEVFVKKVKLTSPVGSKAAFPSETVALSCTFVPKGTDELSALLATAVKADWLILLTDVDGFYVPNGKRTRLLRTVRSG